MWWVDVFDYAFQISADATEVFDDKETKIGTSSVNDRSPVSLRVNEKLVGPIRSAAVAKDEAHWPLETRSRVACCASIIACVSVFGAPSEAGRQASMFRSR